MGEKDLRLGMNGQKDAESRPFADLTLHLNVAFVNLQDAFDNAQTEAKPFPAAPDPVDLEKPVKNKRQIASRDSLASIYNINFGELFVLAHTHVNLTFIRGKFNGIINKAHEKKSQVDLIAGQENMCILNEVGLDAFGFGPGPKMIQSLSEKLIKVNGFSFQKYRLLVKCGQQQQIIDDSAHPFDFLEVTVQEFFVLRRCPATAQRNFVLALQNG